LGVARTATQLEIKKEFFRQAKLYHPDIVHSKRTINYKEAQDKFKDINEAYQVLSDVESRIRYDQFIGLQEAQDSGNYFDENSLYAQILRKRDQRMQKKAEE
jgi:DnaJ-class molecular chaperone